MTVEEFSNEFDILYNNVMSNQAPGLNEYEKSVFLTKAQTEIIKSYFLGETKTANGFDKDSKKQYDFSSLIRVASLYNVNTVKERITPIEKLDRNSKVFLFPKDYFLSINEVIYDGFTQYSVVPISYGEYQTKLLKPYAFPVKKGAWRIFTDKKNCNYFEEKVGTDNNCTYSILTSWADQKRNLQITIGKSDQVISIDSERVENKGIYLKANDNEVLVDTVIIVDSGWSGSTSTYSISIRVTNASLYDDEQIFNLLKYGFKYALENGNPEYDTYKAATHLDGFINTEAPSKFTTIATTGKTFKTKIIELPLAEIIGKFKSDNINYQIRYVKVPTPIVLVDLRNDNLSIDGIDTVTPCTLPSELHKEILQRAVELAKASYTGDLNSMIAAGSVSATDKGIPPSQQQTRQ